MLVTLLLRGTENLVVSTSVWHILAALVQYSIIYLVLKPGSQHLGTESDNHVNVGPILIWILGVPQFGT